MSTQHPKRHLIWVSTINPFETLDVATWLYTTHELQQIGWRVTLIGYGPPGVHCRDSVNIVCLPWPNKYFVGQFIFHFNVLGFLLRNDTAPDVILCHQLSAPWILLLRLRRGLLRQQKPRFVMDTRDLHDITQGSIKVRLRMLFYNLIYKVARLGFDGQTAITTRMAQLVRIPPQQLWGVWPSGVVPETFAVAQKNRRWPQDDEPLQLIYIGILLQKRNLFPLCRAIVRAQEEGMRFVLTLAGTGKESARLTTFARQTDGCVRVLAPVAHDQVPALLAQAHIGVTSLPDPDDAKYEASSPIKLFEYMAAGMPILATVNACHTDVVQDGQYVFWVKAATEDAMLDALRCAWQKRASLSALGRQSAESVADWTWQAAGTKLNDALLDGLQSVGAS